jgi:ribonuclease R
MLDKVGGEFPGVIASVNSFGLFVELEEIYITGLVHITALDKDYFQFDPVGHRLSGERTGKVYRLGDSISVRVAAVNMDDRKIDFVLPDSGSGSDDDKPRSGDRKSGKRPDKKSDRKSGKKGAQKSDRKSDKKAEKDADKKGGRKKSEDKPSATKAAPKAKAKARPKARTTRGKKPRDIPALLVVPEGEEHEPPVVAEPPPAKPKSKPKAKRKRSSRKKS